MNMALDRKLCSCTQCPLWSVWILELEQYMHAVAVEVWLLKPIYLAIAA